MADVLQSGSQGPEVAQLQRRLNAILSPSPNLEVDGLFGSKTRQAVVLFQMRNGLDPDGIVGPLTSTALASLAPDNPDPKQRPHAGDPNWPPKPKFPPLVTDEQRQEVFGKFSFVAEPLPTNKENIRILDDWTDRNIERIEIPQLQRAGVKSAPMKVAFNKKAIPQLIALWNAWENAGLLDRIQVWNGSFVPRYVRGSTTRLSNHAFGSAFDINAATNPLAKVPPLVGEEGCTRELVPIAHEHGFYWGGHFSRPDGMHFEIAVLK